MSSTKKPFICFDFGVEFFIILSAIGCTYSLNRDNNISNFYKRRFKRIVPAFIIVATLNFIIYDLILSEDGDVLLYFKNIFFISFWDGDISFWFILYILICYIFTPYVSKNPNSIILLTLIGISSTALYLYCFTHSHTQNVLLYRFPIYFITLSWIYYARKNNAQWSFVILGIFTTAVYISLILLISYPYKYLLYTLAAIPCLIFIAMLIDISGTKRVRSALSFIGGISLELYLIHEKCLYLTDMISTNIVFRIVSSFAIAITLSFILHTLLTKVNLCQVLALAGKHKS